MKTTVSQIATTTFFALFILVGTASSDGIERSALSHESFEEALELENWMISDSVWNADDFMLFEMEAAFMLELETALQVDVEEDLEVENWMIDETFNSVPNLIMLEAALEIEIEEALEIEDWMTSDKNFNMANIIEIETETEQALEIESWMTDENIWNK